MKTIRVAGICGSLRKSSTNLGLLRYAREHAPEGMEIKIAELNQIPFFNSDLEERPAAVQKLLNEIEEADALLLACPEYNYSLAPALKNALDWASREPDNRLLAGKPAAIVGVAGGMGSARAQYHLRQVCVFLDLKVLNKPEVFCNAFAGGFDETGHLVGDKIQQLVDSQLIALRDWARKLDT